MNKTADTILKHIYKDNKIRSTSTQKFCEKRAFFSNSKMYKSTGGVSMERFQESVLANIIMTKCEKVIVNQLIQRNIVKFYIRFVDDPLVVI